MNKIYRVIWNRTTRCWVVVSEIATSAGKPKNTLLHKAPPTIALCTILFSSSGFAVDYTTTITDPFTFPSGSNSVTTVNNEAPGVFASGGTLTATGYTKINTAGSKSHGITTTGTAGSVINLADVDITTTGDTAYGLRIANTSTFTATGNTKISTAGLDSHGIATIDAGSHANLANVDVTTTGDNADGLIANSGGIINVTGSTKISTYGNKGYGITANSSGSAINLTTVDVTTTGNSSYGMWADSTSIITASGNTKISTTGFNSYGVAVFNGATANLTDINVTTAGNYSSGIVLSDPGSKINVNGGNIITSGVSAHGFAAKYGASKIFDGTSGNVLPHITVSGDGSALLNADGTGSLINLVGQTLSVSQTIGANTWGVLASNGGSVTLQDSTSGGVEGYRGRKHNYFVRE